MHAHCTNQTSRFNFAKGWLKGAVATPFKQVIFLAVAIEKKKTVAYALSVVV
jgi:hypothetical protein